MIKTSEICKLCSSSDIILSFHEERIKNYYDICDEKMIVSLCAHCGFVFQNPILPSIATMDHYVNHSRYALNATGQHVNAKRDQFAWIRSIAESSGFLALIKTKRLQIGLYEIGASVGALLAEGKKAGWDVSGIEPSNEAIESAKNNHQITINQGSLQEVVHIYHPLVVMVHVLEHISDPVSVLKRIYAITESLALLYIEVPDFSFPKNTGGTGFWTPEHVNYFTPETLSRCAKEAGWEILDMHIHSYRDDEGEYCLYPVLRGTFIKRDRQSLLEHRILARDHIADYLKSQFERIRLKLHEFIKQSGNRVVFFGAGEHTAMLLDLMSKEDREAIIAILDSNPQIAGQSMYGHTIEQSTNLNMYGGTGIVISSQGYQSQMVEMVKEKLGSESLILTFY